MRKKQRDTLPRRAMKLLCSLLGILLGLMLAVTCGFQLLLDRVSAPSGGSVPVFSLSAAAAGAEKAVALSQGTRESRVVNILLIGQDRREGESQARSDSMILCSLDRDAGKLTMTSFLRDLYVPIPGHGGNRINAAYAYGGMALLERTIEDNFGITVDGAVEVDFQQFAGIIDLLGGVAIELRQDEADIINRETGSSLTEGKHLLTGAQALAYSRIRSLDADGDFSRTGRQRKVMEALVAGFRGAGAGDLLELMTQLFPMLTTDLSRGQLLVLALEVLPQLSGLQLASQRIPADGTFFDDTIDGMRVLVADMDAARRLLRETAS